MESEPVSLATLAAVVAGELVGDGERPVLDVTHDSRLATDDDLFVALRGAHHDGHDFVAATRAGAVCVEELQAAPIPQLVVTNTRLALGPLAAAVHHHPSSRMSVVGITGTNGKTTATQMLASIGRAHGLSTGIIGTIGGWIGDRQVDLAHTSPEASDFQRLLRQMVEAGVRLAAVEVSSHALEYGRTNATDFAAVAFTNLSQDHLDFHGDMESYFAAKARLFETGAPAVVAIEDEYGRRLAARIGPRLTVGSDGDVWAEILDATVRRTSFRMHTPEGSIEVDLPIGGDFNVVNGLVAAGCALVLGYPLAAIGEGLATLASIPGRFELVPGSHPFSVFVDYAHTPEGVARAIRAVRPLAKRVIVVVGAAGDRDRGKRAPMGVAATEADLAVVTSDNPRSESPEELVAEVMAGVTGAAVAEVDRRKAIRLAIREAAPGDVVLILGKGHERGQEIGGVMHPFSDRLVAQEELEAL